MLSLYWPQMGLLGVIHLVVVLVVVPWVLLTKKEPTSAIAWCLVVLMMPLVGAVLYWAFGYNYLLRQARRRRANRPLVRERRVSRHQRAVPPGIPGPAAELAHLALRVNAFPVSQGNGVVLYRETEEAFAALLDAIRQARHHVHLEYFIFRSDATGQQMIELLAEKAKEGVEVRLLYDAMGCVHLRWQTIEPLVRAGGRVEMFLPLNPLRSRIQVNLRNHRKITVVDGRVGFTGGMNIGDEYLGRNAYFGHWRDDFLRLEGPAVGGLQRIFCEDWEFACRELLQGEAYFPELTPSGDGVVQLAESGPDQEINTIREIYFMAILSARRRLWLASPYFVPDSGILDALRVASHRGVDIRFLTLLRPDHYSSFYAGRYYWTELLAMGVQIYQYQRGMMHSKLMLVDDHWAMASSANLDNRSLHLNFEVGVALLSPQLIAELEAVYRRDLEESLLLDPETYANRPLISKLVENACRLMAPVL